LEVGDYILSSRIGIEFKNVKDFVDSIIDKRLLLQVRDLKKYEKPLLLIEGEEDIYSQRNIHPNAINGILSSIVIDYGVPILRTKNSNETALLFMTIAKREQKKKEEDFTLHHHKPSTLKEQQEYIISSLPGVGGILSKPLLKKFGSVKNIVNSSVEELKKVELIGDIKAKNIKKVIDSEYNKK
jgi:Fanconi anemia group M protein